MEPGCKSCPADLLDHLYGLLDQVEADAVAAHLAGCPACAAAADRAKGLLTAAAKGHFPDVTFAPPVEVARPDERGTVSREGVRWAVAFGLALGVCGLMIPTARDTADFFDARPAVVAAAGKVADARDKYKTAQVQLAADRVAADRRLDEARRQHEELVTAWVAEEKTALEAAANRPFAVEVRGPAAAVPGAPNEYAVRVTGKDGKARKAKLTATVTAADGTALYTHTEPATEAATLKLPASLWAKLPAGGEAFLQVRADDAGGTATLREPVRLLGPVFATFLTTDKPLYQAGETVYFRSTTLDRTRLAPPETEVLLRFELSGPDGKAIETQTGLAKAVVAQGGKLVDVVGPDGRPVRGVGCGAFALKPDAPGGTYTLTVSELPPFQTPGSPRVLAKRVFQVATYRPDALEKKLDFDASSYGPGEPVSAKLTVTAQGKPFAGAKLRAVAKADDKSPAVSADAVTGPDGSASVRFALPSGDEPKQATLSVTVERAGVVETVIRPVPLAGRRLTVEFFPEGGDLVAGLSNRVYVRVTTASGKPADLVGVLHDGEREVCPVRTLRDADRPGANRGLGLFTVTPVAGKTYTLKVSQPAGAVGEFKLPAAKPAGVVLHARDAATKPGEPIRVTLGHAGAKPLPVLVGAYARGRALAHARAVLAPGRTTDVALDPGLSPVGGVTRITVFADDAGGDGRTDLTPLAERLVFRRPKESLALSAKLDKPFYLPGDPVRLNVTAKTETGSPTAAVVFAAVVSRSVLAMADDTAERSLPTHFLVGGEVRHPDELEHADYLLTDHPHAAESLDLVLGTQGWRRFAEQAPEEFRTRVPAAEADRLLASLGASAPQFVRSEVQAVADRNWPKYEAAALTLERAEEAVKAFGRATDASGLTLVTPADIAGIDYEQARNGLSSAMGALKPVDDTLTVRRWSLLFTGPLLLAAVGGMLWRYRRADRGERRWLAAGLVGAVLVGAVLVAGSVVTADLGAEWRREADQVPPGPIQPPTLGAAPQPAPAPPEPEPERNTPQVDRTKSGQPPGSGKEPPTEPAIKKLDPRPAVDDGKPAPRRPAVARPLPGRPNVDNPTLKRLQASLDQRTDKADEPGVKAVRGNTPATKPLLVREYAHTPPNRTPDAPRSDFTETVLWKPVVVLPDSGTADLTFALGDSPTGYRVLVAGHTLDGRLGAVTETLTVKPPLAVDAKLPPELSAADRPRVPLAVTFNTPDVIEARATLSVGGKALGSDDITPGGRLTVGLPPLPVGSTEVVAAVQAFGLKDAVRRTVNVVPDGFPAGGAKSERFTGKLAATVTLPGDRVPGGTRVAVTVYPSALAGVMGGLDGLLKEPHGCFEQASSTNYPNVLALDYLRTTGGGSLRSRQLMDSGYRRLSGYECPDTPTRGKQGFEWFGAADRPHPALSAYGLLQFADMSRVHPVDPALIARTKSYLLSLRTGDGTWKRSTAALDRFGRAPATVTDAYVVWAVSEAERGGDPSDLTKELDTLLKNAGDPYVAGLVANAALNRGRTDDAVKLLDALVAKQAADGSVPGAATTITSSAGDDRLTETTAVALLGWLKADRPDKYTAAVGKAVGFLATKRNGDGAFGATQATVLALKALVEHARRNTGEPEAGEVRLRVAGKVVGTAAVRTDAAGPVTVEVPDAEAAFPPGQGVEVVAESSLKQAVPATLSWAARTVQPPAAADAPLTVEVKLDRTELPEGETARLSVAVANRTDAVTGMGVAVVGLPAGLVVPADGKQLRKLTDDGAVDFWEVRGRELVLYWRGFDAKQERRVSVELAASFPGDYRGPASRAYLYYDAGRKHWVAPLVVAVR